MASETENDTKGKELLPGVSSTILGLSLTTLLTVCGYLTAFAATAARATYFHIPLDYVVIGVTQIVEVAAWLLLVCSLTLPVLVSIEIARSLSRPTPVPVFREEWFRVLCVFLLWLSGAAIWFFNGFFRADRPWAVLIYGAFLVVMIVPVLYSQRAEERRGRYKIVINVFSSVYSYGLGLFIIVCAVAWYVGNEGAASQTDFDIIDYHGRTYDGYAVMWTSTDILVLASVNITDRCFGDHFATVKLEGEHAALMWRHRDKIGPLTYCSQPAQVVKHK